MNNVVWNAVGRGVCERVALNFSLADFSKKIGGFVGTNKPLHGYTLDAVEREVKKHSGDIAKVSGAGGVVSKILSAVEKAREELKTHIMLEWAAKHGRKPPQDAYTKLSIPANWPIVAELRSLLDLAKSIADRAQDAERKGAAADRAQAERASRKFQRDFDRKHGEGLRMRY